MLSVDPAVQVALVTGVFSVVVLVLKTLADLRAVKVGVAKANEQVANSHSTNLRDDLDRVRDDVNRMMGMVADQGHVLATLVRSVDGERDARVESDAALRSSVLVMVDALPCREGKVTCDG